MRNTEKEHKKLKKWSESNTTNSVKKTKNTKEEPLPAWFNEEQSVTETTEEEKEELDKILNELI